MALKLIDALRSKEASARPAQRAGHGRSAIKPCMTSAARSSRSPPARTREQQKRRGPGEPAGSKAMILAANPDAEHISTSYVERQDLTMRMGMRGSARLTKGFSEKVESLAAALALHSMPYNSCRVHQRLKTTLAVAAGVNDREWKLEDVVTLL